MAAVGAVQDAEEHNFVMTREIGSSHWLRKMSARSQSESSRAQRRRLRRDSRLLLQVSRATGSVVSMVQRRSIMAEDANRCAVSGDGMSVVDRVVRGAFMTYKATRTRPSFGSSEHKQSLIFRVLNYAVQIDDIEDVHCYCLDVGHQSWRPAEVS